MANRMMTYIILMAGLVLLFHFSGLTRECGVDGECKSITPNGKLLSLLTNPENIRDATIGDILISSLAGLGIAGSLVLSGVFYHRIEYAAVASFTVFVLVVMWDFIVIFNVVRETNVVFAILFLAPFLLAYFFVVLDFYRGKD